MRGYEVYSGKFERQYFLPDGKGKYIKLPEGWVIIQVMVLNRIH